MNVNVSELIGRSGIERGMVPFPKIFFSVFSIVQSDNLVMWSMSDWKHIIFWETVEMIVGYRQYVAPQQKNPTSTTVSTS